MVNKNLPLAWIVFWPYFFLIVVGLLVPSDGQHGLFSAKSMAFILTCASLGLYSVLRGQFTVYQVKIFLFLLISIVFLICWLLIGILHENSLQPSQIDQFKLFFITISFPLITLYLIKENALSSSQFLKIVIYSNFTYALAKVSLVILHLLNILDMWKIIEGLGIRFMRMSITGTLERVQTSVDIVTPFLIFFLLESKTFGHNFKKSFKIFYLTTTLLSSLLSFSRYLIFIYFCSLVIYSLNLNLGRWAKMTGGAIALLIGIYFILGTENINNAIERRLMSIENFTSDSVRIHQMTSLLTEYEKVPFFGKGLGGYSSKNIRDHTLLHHYEVQWLAFLMQFGLCGVLLILAALGFIAYGYFIPPLSIKKLSFFMMFLLWIFSGFTNPFLISLASGIIYALFLVSSLKINFKLTQINP